MAQQHINTDNCWLYAGWKTPRGYGNITWWDGKRQINYLAHRAMYEEYYGAIEKGLVIDHLCKTFHCINPEHLEAVTQKENVLRGVGIASVNARKKHCSRGHVLSGENIRITKNGGRMCLLCKKITQRTYKERIKTYVQ